MNTVNMFCAEIIQYVFESNFFPLVGVYLLFTPGLCLIGLMLLYFLKRGWAVWLFFIVLLVLIGAVVIGGIGFMINEFISQ